MDAAEALTVIPRSRSTLRVSRSVISSLVSLVVAEEGLVDSDENEVFSVFVVDTVDDSPSTTDADDEVPVEPLLFIALSDASSSYSSGTSFARSCAISCLELPRFPVYSRIRDAKLDFP